MYTNTKEGHEDEP